MAKQKTSFVCKECGSEASKWAGQCGDCGGWNSMSEITVVSAPKASRYTSYAGTHQNEMTLLADVKSENTAYITTGIGELDRVLGKGMVEGAVVLIGGDPGIGKSTLILQMMANLSQESKVLYVTGEESLSQISMRARRLDLVQANIQLLAETQVEQILRQSQSFVPQVLVVDSIQTVYTEQVTSAPGSVSQVRESAAALVRFAKQTNTALFLIGHVTKEGMIAGPRVLEHMVDTVLYFEGQKDNRFRVIRSIKNRFGAVNELGIFAMTDKGLKGVSNPSAIFLSKGKIQGPGSIVMVTWEGRRPLLIEVQALVDDSALPNPRRVCVGLDGNRLAMLLAVLHQHGSVALHGLDIFINIVGGMKITETGVDLAIVLALISSFKNKAIPDDWVVFGEVGLGGEIRPVQAGQERLQDSCKHGFKVAIIPHGNQAKLLSNEMTVHAVKTVEEAVALL